MKGIRHTFTNIIISVFLSVFMLFAKFVAKNTDQIHCYAPLLTLFVLVFCVALVPFALLWIFARKSRADLAIIPLYAVPAFFLFSDIGRVAISLKICKLADFYMLSCFIWAALYIAMITVVWVLSKYKTFRVFSYNAIAAMTLYFSCFFIYKLCTIEDVYFETRSFGKFDKKPNVYLLLIDGYPNSSIIEKIYNEKDTLAKSLDKMGFYIPKITRANYLATCISMSSQMMCRYHDSKIANRPPPFTMATMVKMKNNVLATFKDNGYDFAYGYCGAHVSLRPEGEENFLIDTKSVTCSDMRVFASTMLSHTIVTCKAVRRNYLSPADCARFLSHKSFKKPVFFFAHFLQIHDLMCKNERIENAICSFHNPCDIRNKRARAAFYKSMQEFTPRFIKMVRKIIEKDPSAIVIVESDHGVNISDKKLGFKSKNLPKNKARNFMAVYVQGKGREEMQTIFGKKHHNVNLFRNIFRYLGVRTITNLPYSLFSCFSDGPVCTDKKVK